MRKKKKEIQVIEPVLIVNNLFKIYIYKRNRLLLNPIPHKFKIDIIKIKEIIHRINNTFT
jgi:hypothetical protein